MTKKKTMFVAAVLLVATSLSAATHYPDSVLQKSAEEPYIATGWNFEFGGGVGVSSFTFRQLGSQFESARTSNHIHFPAWNAGIGINYYFVPWMGIGVGAEFASYSNRTVLDKPWTQTTYDKYGTNPWSLYTITSTPNNLAETQTIYMVEVPLALKFRARPGKLGFIGTAGVKLGIPVRNRYNLPSGGYFDNQVYYEYFDLLMQDVPGVLDDVTIPGKSGSLPVDAWTSQPSLKFLNYAAFLELGMLIRVHQRVDLAISAYGTYYFNDVMKSNSTQPLGFYDGTKAGEYPMPYTTAYDGVLRSDEVESLHPWAAGLKFTVHVNAGKTKAKRDYDRELRRLRRAERDSLEKARREEEERLKLQAQQQATESDEDAQVVVVVTDNDTDNNTDNDIDARIQAMDEIMRIARENNIDLCEVFCNIHDTIYIYRDAEADGQQTSSVPDEDTIARRLEEELAGAIIYFDLDKTIPILEPKDILDRIAAMLRQHPDQKIYVNGHACKLGKADYNKRLALRRAQAVAAKLRKLGVRDDQMIIRSLGADVPYRYNGHHQLSKDRRVEIIPVYRSQDDTQDAPQDETQVTSAAEETQAAQMVQPQEEVRPATTAAPVISTAHSTKEVVRPGSRLAQIARRHYNEAEFWIFIYEANRDKINDPSNLLVGTELIIPNLDERCPGMTKEQKLAEARRLKQQLLHK